MATIQKRDRSYRVRICRKNFPTLTTSFDTRAQADAWARQRESDMDRGVVHVATVEAERTTVADLIERYLTEVTVTHKGAESEAYRLRALARPAWKAVRRRRARPLPRSAAIDDSTATKKHGCLRRVVSHAIRG